MKVKITWIGVYSQGILSGDPSCVLSIPTALINDQSLTQKIELGSASKFYGFFSHFQILSFLFNFFVLNSL